jgi:hypothetical protein
MSMNQVFDPYGEGNTMPNPITPGNNLGSQNPAVLVDKMIGTAYDVVKHVCRYIEEVRHVSAHMEQVFRVSGDLTNLDALSAQLENLTLIAESLDELLALAVPMETLEGRVDVLEAQYVPRTGNLTVAGNKRMSGFTALGPDLTNNPAFQMKFLTLTTPATDASTTINVGLTTAERARVLGLIPMVRVSVGAVFLGSHEFLNVSLVANGAGTDLQVSLGAGHPSGWNSAEMTVCIILKAP